MCLLLVSLHALLLSNYFFISADVILPVATFCVEIVRYFDNLLPTVSNIVAYIYNEYIKRLQVAADTKSSLYYLLPVVSIPLIFFS